MTAYTVKTFLLLVVIWAEGIVAKKTLEERVSVLEHKLARQQAMLHSTENTTFSSTLSRKATKLGCPDRFDRAYGQFCYFFSDEEVTWYVAKEECKNLNNEAYLAQILTSDENHFLRHETMRVGESRWIGLYDANGHFMWTWYGSPSVGPLLDYYDWASGEPNNEGLERCVHFDENADFHWNNADCNKNFTYLCQVKRNGNY